MMKKQSEGRSMVEMLGVLAIMGVLSIGGLYGLKQARDSGWSTHWAAEAVYITKELATQEGWRSQLPGSTISVTDVGSEIQVIKEQGDAFKIILPPVSTGVCVLLLPKLTNFTVYENETLITDDKASHCKDDISFTLRYRN